MAADRITIARPYAKAVFESAVEHGSIAKWSSQLEILAQIVMQQSVHEVLATPMVSSTQLVELFSAIAKDKLGEQSLALVKLLANNKRLDLLPEIKTLFEVRCRAQDKTIIANVIVASEPSQSQLEQISINLKRKLKLDVELKIQIDKSIIGGAIIRAADLVIDGSVRGKLNRLKHIIAA